MTPLTPQSLAARASAAERSPLITSGPRQRLRMSLICSDDPRRVGQPLPDQLGARLDRNTKAVAYVVLAIRRDRNVHGDHECVEAGGGDPFDQPLNSAWVARDVGLIPRRRAG